MGANDITVWLGETTIAVSILLILVLLIRKPFANYFGARAAYALWLMPLARIFMPELNLLAPPEIAFEEMAFVYPTSTAVEVTNASAPFPIVSLLTGAAVFLWAAIAIAIFSYRLEAQSRFLKLMVSKSSAAPNSISNAAKRIASSLGLKRTPKIRVCDNAFGPAIVGLFRPVLFVPHDFETRYSASEQRLALAHEIAHIARGDLPMALLASALQAIQWPNPLAYFAMHAFRTDQEAACDAFVMQRISEHKDETGEYASAILKSASAENALAHGLTLGHPVKERLMLLKNAKVRPVRMLAGSVGAGALILGGLMATASYGYAAEKEKKVEKVKEVVVSKDSKVVITSDSDFDSDDIEILINDIEFEDADGNIEVIVHSDDDGKKVVKKKVMVLPGNGEHDMHFFGDGDGEGKSFKVVRKHKDGKVWASSNCSTTDGEGEPAKLEWKDESGDENNKHVEHMVICVSGEDATPENRAEALRKAIARIEDNAKKEHERRKKMIAGLKKQLRELEKQERKKK